MFRIALSPHALKAQRQAELLLPMKPWAEALVIGVLLFALRARAVERIPGAHWSVADGPSPTHVRPRSALAVTDAGWYDTRGADDRQLSGLSFG